MSQFRLDEQGCQLTDIDEPCYRTAAKAKQAFIVAITLALVCACSQFQFNNHTICGQEWTHHIPERSILDKCSTQNADMR